MKNLKTWLTFESKIAKIGNTSYIPEQLKDICSDITISGYYTVWNEDVVAYKVINFEKFCQNYFDIKNWTFQDKPLNLEDIKLGVFGTNTDMYNEFVEFLEAYERGLLYANEMGAVTKNDVIQKSNESRIAKMAKSDPSYTFEDLDFEESDMWETTSIMNCLSLNDFKDLGELIKTTLNPDILTKMFRADTNMDLILFSTSIEREDLERMFTKISVHPGADDEDEWVVKLKIENRIVLLLASPERGSTIRIQDDNHRVPKEALYKIIETLCLIYNDRF